MSTAEPMCDANNAPSSTPRYAAPVPLTPAEIPADEAETSGPGRMATTVTHRAGNGQVQGGVRVEQREEGRRGEVSAGYQFGSGQWRDDDGVRQGGVRARGTLLHAELETAGGNARLEANGPSFDVGAVISEDGTMSVGASASLADVAGTIGTSDPNRSDDQRLRVGLSEGVGAALRMHYRDDDHDGHPEVGAGGDLGPFTVDYTHEVTSEPEDRIARLDTDGMTPEAQLLRRHRGLPPTHTIGDRPATVGIRRYIEDEVRDGRRRDDVIAQTPFMRQQSGEQE